MFGWNAGAGVAVQEAIRPRNSGEVVDTHVFAQPRNRVLDYEQMRRAVTGEKEKASQEKVPLEEK